MKYAIAAIALPLALSAPAQDAAGAGPSASGSFKSGFSSQGASQRASPPSKGSFGSFGKRSSSSSSSTSSSSSSSSTGRGGGFGSFGGTAAPDARRSDSALSRKLDRDAAEARALRTLEQRRAAQAARNAPPPPAYDQAPRNQPGYGQAPRSQPGYGQAPRSQRDYGPAPRSQPDYGQAQGPVRQGSGLGPIIAGAVIANAAANAHAQRNGAQAGNGQAPAPLPEQTWNGGVGSVNAGAAGGSAAQPAPAPAQANPKAAQGGGAVFGTIVTLALLAALGWGVYKLVRRRRRGAAKPNYSFERN